MNIENSDKAMPGPQSFHADARQQVLPNLPEALGIISLIFVSPDYASVHSPWQLSTLLSMYL